MKKIAIIDHVGRKAGMDYYSYNLAKGFQKNNVHPIIISNFTVPDIETYSYFIGHTNSKIKKVFNYINAFKRAALTSKLKGCDKAIIHLFSYELKDIFALFILKLWRIKVIAIVHDVENLGVGNKVSFQRFIYKYLADKLLLHNQFSYIALIENFGKSLSQKSMVIAHGHYNGLIDRKIKREEARSHFLMIPNNVYLLFFGQIKVVKGLDVLIKSMQLLPAHVCLVIAGKPWKEDFNQYELMINELGLENRVIKLVRFIEDSERDLLFSACDLLILPYKKIFQSGVMLMAMAYRIPIIASNLKPMMEMITDNYTGLLFESENEVSLSEVIIRAIFNRDKLSEMANNAWQLAEEQCDWQKIASVIELNGSISGI